MEVDVNRKLARIPVVAAGVDFSEPSLHAAVVAASFSRSHDVHDLHLVHVIEPLGENAVDEWTDGATFYQGAADRALSELEVLCVSLEAAYPVLALSHVVTGDPCREIARVAIEVGSHLI